MKEHERELAVLQEIAVDAAETAPICLTRSIEHRFADDGRETVVDRGGGQIIGC